MKIKYKIKNDIIAVGKIITILEEPESWHSGGIRRNSWKCPVSTAFNNNTTPIKYPFKGKILEIISKENDSVNCGAINVDGYGFSLRTIKYIINED